MSGSGFLQLKDSSMCGIIAAMQICNWYMPMYWPFLNRAFVVPKAKKRFRLLDDSHWLDPNETNVLTQELFQERVNFKGIKGLKLFNPLEQELMTFSKSQMLCSLGENHFIVIHGTTPDGLFIVSGLADPYGNYLGLILLSSSQLFGGASIQVNNISMKIPKGSVKPLYKY